MSKPAHLHSPEILARGPWAPERVETAWGDELFVATDAQIEAADAEIEALKRRNSPSYDGLAGRIVDFTNDDDRLELELQPMRWALRLIRPTPAPLSVQAVVRSSDGKWLSGKRADWVASWRGRWTLGAGGAVEVGEAPMVTMVREIEEEWSVTPVDVCAVALMRLPSGAVMLVGDTWLKPGAEVTRDPEHSEHRWLPKSIDSWPDDIPIEVATLARLVVGSSDDG